MELLINKLKRSGFLPMSAPSTSTLANEADRRLFRAVTQNPKLLPEARRGNYYLRPRAHGVQLPTKTTETLFLASYTIKTHSNTNLCFDWSLAMFSSYTASNCEPHDP